LQRKIIRTGQLRGRDGSGRQLTGIG
jgi:hypothetical protein